MFRTTTNEAITVTLRDPLGRIVHRAGALSGRGNLHRMEIPANIAPGTYLLTATSISGAFYTFRVMH